MCNKSKPWFLQICFFFSSLALTSHTYSKTYDWLKNNRELLNVAVSRAKDKFIIFSNSEELKRLHKNDDSDDLYELAEYVKKNGEYKITPRVSSSREVFLSAE